MVFVNVTSNFQGIPPLASACENNNLEMIDMLLECGADPDGIPKDRTRDSCAKWQKPILFAAKKGNALIVERLVQAGADPTVRKNGVCFLVL